MLLVRLPFRTTPKSRPDCSFVGMITNTGRGALQLPDDRSGIRILDDDYIVDSDECLRITTVFVSNARKNCQEDGLAQGGMNRGRREGVSFTLFPVDL